MNPPPVSVATMNPPPVSVATMSVQPRRIRLKPWLLAQVDSGRYPGLGWMGPDHRLFLIPWKHATRHTPSSDEENTIFKAWAVATGKFQDGVDDPDPAKWKANLRCALNKSREFQLKYDGTKETPLQPYKIYEVLEQPGSAGDRRRHDGVDVEVEVDVDEDEDEMPNLMDLSIDPRIGDSAPFRISDSAPFRISDSAPFRIGDSAHSEPSRFGPLMGGVPTATAAPDLMDATMRVETSDQDQDQTPAAAAAAACKYDLLSSVPLTDLDLKFQYRGRTAGSLTVSNPQGCRLYYGHLEPTPQQVDLFGPVGLQQVLLPGATEIQNQKQRFYTEALLDVMERGLILEICQQDIYAVRLCQCKVFWSGPGTTEPGPPNPMEREKKIRVFSLNDFLQGLILFQRGEAPTPPPFEIHFCFGEDWPDQKPREKKLIMVQVVPVVARILTEMFSGELSWSTDSIRLQISNPDVKDQTVEQFKELQRLLQSQHIQGPWALQA